MTDPKLIELRRQIATQARQVYSGTMPYATFISQFGGMEDTYIGPVVTLMERFLEDNFQLWHKDPAEYTAIRRQLEAAIKRLEDSAGAA